MKKKAKAKTKSSSTKPAAKRTAARAEKGPDLLQLVAKISERLESVEQKVDLLLAQSREPQSQETDHENEFEAQAESLREDERERVHENEAEIQPSFQPQTEVPTSRGRGGRPLFQTVCAECGKNCEVPFKPTGERPIYCKECYSKRKKKGQGKPRPPHGRSHSQRQHPYPQQRQVKVIPNGVGKVTISELVTSGPMPQENSRYRSNNRHQSGRADAMRQTPRPAAPEPIP